MGTLPIVVEMEHRPCLVVGGGAVAERKVETLLGLDAEVTVVSPSLAPRLSSWAQSKKIAYLARRYRKNDLRGYDMAFVATNDGRVNAKVAEDGRRIGVWVNTADDPRHCDFILPAIVRRGRLVVAVSTGGASPAMARRVREVLEEHVTEEVGTLVEEVAQLRQEMRGKGDYPSAEAWQAVLREHFSRLVETPRKHDIETALRKTLGEER